MFGDWLSLLLAEYYITPRTWLVLRRICDKDAECKCGPRRAWLNAVGIAFYTYLTTRPLASR